MPIYLELGLLGLGLLGLGLLQLEELGLELGLERLPPPKNRPASD